MSDEPEVGIGRQGPVDFADFPKGLWAQLIAGPIIIVLAVMYLAARWEQQQRGINVECTFQAIPPE